MPEKATDEHRLSPETGNTPLRCYYCMQSVDEGTAAKTEDGYMICPYCGVDSVVDFDNSDHVLETLHRLGFSVTRPVTSAQQNDQDDEPQPLNAGQLIEAVDRIYLSAKFVESSLLDHRLIDSWPVAKAEAERAVAILYDLYQTVGALDSIAEIRRTDTSTP